VLPEASIRDKDAARVFYDALIRRVENLPGVTSAAVVTDVPLTNSGKFCWSKHRGPSAIRAPDRIPIVIYADDQLALLQGHVDSAAKRPRVERRR
jgi:hypothetical protein